MQLAREKWTKKDYQEFCSELFGLSEAEYQEFAQRGTPTERPFLGVRIPKQRAMAKEILRGNPTEFLGPASSPAKFEPIAFEEVNVRGFVIAGLPYEEMMERIDNFVALIDNWGTCDTFVATAKSIKKHRENFLAKIDQYLASLGEFQTRVALVSLLSYYVSPEYLQVIFDRISGMETYISDGPGEMGIRHDDEQGKLLAWDAYYVKMAIAWLLAECFIKFPDETIPYLKQSKLPKWTYNKTISKICDSYRVEKSIKSELKDLRK